MTPTEVRLALLKGDYDPIPLRGKNPGLMEKWAWQKIGHANAEQVDLWAKSFPDATNTGALTLRMPTFDIDIEDADAAEAVEMLVLDRFGDHGHVLTRIGKPPKRAIPFRGVTPFAKITHKVIRADGVEERFEFLSDGQQLVVHGIHPDTRRPYRWAHGELLRVPRADLPLISAEDAEALVRDAAELVIAEHGYRDKATPCASVAVDGGSPLPADWVAYFDNLIDHDNNAAAIMALIRGGTHPGIVSNLFHQKIRALTYRGPPRGRAEWEARRARRLAEIPGMIETALRKVTAQPEDAPLYSEEALALLFAERHGPDFRYLPAYGRWIRWTETQWREDETTLAYDHARAIVREQAKTAAKTAAIRIASAHTVAAVERLARVDRRIVMAASAFDSDPDVVNAGGQIVDLRTGATRPITREDFCLKCTAVAPADAATCPMWLAFLDRIMNKNRDLIAFLQRWCGYCLSDRIDEEVLLFLYGTGANGKTVFINTITGIIGSYGQTAPMDMFMYSQHEHHPTELARLVGRRLVTANETTRGRRWDEAKIKNLTGSDKIAARFMRQDFFEFDPTHKLMLAGNSKPGLMSVDEAIRRRIALAPFAVQIPKDERDPELALKLRPERPAILRWIIDGAAAWYAGRLQIPEAVHAPTKEYLDDQDSLGQWVEERTKKDPRAFTRTRDLFADWSAWCAKLNLSPGTEKAFVEDVKKLSWTQDRNNKGRGFDGVTLTDPEQKELQLQGEGEPATEAKARI
jgi:putative DNA primase/helicase